MKRLQGLQKAETHLEAKVISTMEPFCEYT